VHHARVSDTIVALATPPGTAALAVVRMSGDEALAVADRVFRGKRTVESLPGFAGAHGRVVHESAVVDEVVVWVYRAPRSYTGEDLVEFSCHGGVVPAERVLEALWAAGARPADPGEFTRRAFLNGRIDLTQAEAVASLISARGRRAQEQALVQLEGGLSRRIRGLAEEVRGVLARLTVFLDFDEDVPDPPDVPQLCDSIRTAAMKLQSLAQTHAPSRRVRDGITVAFAGRPNVGKSSLLNALAGFDRAIVHETPGTTRDVLDARLELGGIPVRLVDTAGVRRGHDPVEAAGIERTERELRGADMVLWVVEGPAGVHAEDLEVGRLVPEGRRYLVLNKVDLGRVSDEWVSGHSLSVVNRLQTSALTGDGIGSLLGAIESALARDLEHTFGHEELWVGNERQAEGLARAAEAVSEAARVLGEGHPAELAAADLQRGLAHLAEITGDRAGEDLLDSIFGRFCIGK
jgi:tRNA modification GTPase